MVKQVLKGSFITNPQLNARLEMIAWFFSNTHSDSQQACASIISKCSQSFLVVKVCTPPSAAYSSRPVHRL